MNPAQEILSRKFAEIAQRYCFFSEHNMPQDKAEMLAQLSHLLPELYGAALNLPNIETNGESVQSIHSPFEQSQAIRRRIGEVLGECDLYWEVFNPYHLEEPVSQTLGDDLADIYCDVKEGLLLMQRGSSADTQEAVLRWRESFFQHWGEHLVDALRVLNRANASMMDI